MSGLAGTELVESSKSWWSNIVPLPVIVDADFLSRSVSWAVLKGYEPAIVGRASSRYSSFTGVVVFVTESVFEETVDRFEEIALERGVAVEEVVRVWDTLFGPRVRIVDMDGCQVDDPRVADVERRDSDDQPTAALAVLLAPCVLLTDNWHHFQAFGFPRGYSARPDISNSTTALSVDVWYLGEFLQAMNAGTLPPRLAGLAVIEGGKAAYRFLGRDLSVALALILLGGLALYWRTPGGKRMRASVVETVKRVSAEQGPAISNFFASGTTVGERLAAFTVEPGDKTPLSFICRRLVSDPTMKTVDIADYLHWNGYRYSPANTHRKRVRAWLVSQPLLWEIERGL